jgi:hypothetical protein
MCPPRPARIMTTVSAVSARGTVEMLNAPERANVSTDMPSQAPNPSKLANNFADHSWRPRSSNTTKLCRSLFDGDPLHAPTLYFSSYRMGRSAWMRKLQIVLRCTVPQRQVLHHRRRRHTHQHGGCSCENRLVNRAVRRGEGT